MADFDIVIVGAGHAGAFMAYELGMKGKKVLVLESGPGTPRHREDYMESFYLAGFKSPESPYPPDANTNQPGKTNAPHPTLQQLVFGWNNPEISYLTYTDGSMPFGSTYLRMAGGTGNHWQATVLRMTPDDFKLNDLTEKKYGLNWPFPVSELDAHYAKVEAFMGVSADAADQRIAGDAIPEGYQFPMPAIPYSVSDNYIRGLIDNQSLTNDDYGGKKVTVTRTPQARNSIPYDNRRACHGNTSCVPICPIQAKYDPAFALNKALATGNVEVRYKTVVDYVSIGHGNEVVELHYITYDDISVPAKGGKTGEGTVSAVTYVLAASAIENAKILLNSPWVGKTVANSSDMVGRHLMDHPAYLAWGLFPKGVRAYSYRGPLATAGVETLRTGPFRKERAAWRIELGNEGWNWAKGEPYTIGTDFLYGVNGTGLNPTGNVKGNHSLLQTLNDYLTREFRIAILMEQDADPNNRVQLSPTYKDNLGIPRPLLTYHFSEYVKKGFVSASLAARKIMDLIKAEDFTKYDVNSGRNFKYNNIDYKYYGAGHVCGTHIMGTDKTKSVVDVNQRSWDHPNLYIVGCGSMPSIGTQNPTLTMVALASKTVDAILKPN